MKASELAVALGGTLEGEDVDVFACAGLEEARAGDLSFCKDAKHVRLVETTAASAVLLPSDWSHGAPCAVIKVADPDLSCMKAAAMLALPAPVRSPGVHPTALVDPSVKLGRDVDPQGADVSGVAVRIPAAHGGNFHRAGKIPFAVVQTQGTYAGIGDDMTYAGVAVIAPPGLQHGKAGPLRPDGVGGGGPAPDFENLFDRLHVNSPSFAKTDR